MLENGSISHSPSNKGKGCEAPRKKETPPQDFLSVYLFSSTRRAVPAVSGSVMRRGGGHTDFGLIEGFRSGRGGTWVAISSGVFISMVDDGGGVVQQPGELWDTVLRW